MQKQESNSVAAFCPRPLATESCRCLVSAFDPKQTLAFGTESQQRLDLSIFAA